MGLKLRTRFVRTFFFLFGDLISIFGGYVVATLIFLFIPSSNAIAFEYSSSYPLIGFLIAGLAGFGMYSVSWRFTSLRELVRIVYGLTAGFAAFLIICGVTGFISNQLTVFSAIVFTVSLLFIGAFRISKRLYLEIFRHPASHQNVVIFGAGNACDQIMRDIQRNNNWKLNVGAIFDDAKSLKGVTIQGVKVQGDSEALYDYLDNFFVSELIIAAPSIPKKRLKEITDEVNKINPDLTVKVVPSFHRLSNNPIGVKNIRDIRIEDILGREPADVDINSIRKNIEGKRVFITGAGGSIGSEIVHQCSKLNPETLIAFDIDETELYRLENEFSDDANLVTLVGDVTDSYKMDALIAEYKPDTVYHAAAYKHVPMMERFPEEAIKVNIKGTQNLAYLCCEHNVGNFVLISTDKAVNPTNVMGATKRIAEQICMTYNDIGFTKFIAVRFGNVLGSRGSVVPLFMKQINDGGPVTVTDPEITRYFMTIPEAVLLVMQAGSMGSGGEVFLLDMGEPVKILNMAKVLIQLNGLVPDKDIDIKIKGLRRGEKMYEELLNEHEGAENTAHEQIFKTNSRVHFSYVDINRYIEMLTKDIQSKNYDSLQMLLKKGVPTYQYGSHLESIKKTAN